MFSRIIGPDVHYVKKMNLWKSEAEIKWNNGQEHQIYCIYNNYQFFHVQIMDSSTRSIS